MKVTVYSRAEIEKVMARRAAFSENQGICWKATLREQGRRCVRPAKYIPTECFLSGIDQSKVDNSTEEWLDTIEDKIEYEAWYLGHWHTDKRIDKMHFLFHDVEVL